MLRRNVLIEAHDIPWPTPSGWQALLSAPDETSISGLVDFTSILSRRPDSADPPGIQGGFPREFCNAAHAFQQQPNKNIPAQPTARWPPILDAGTEAARPRGDCAESSGSGGRHMRADHARVHATCSSHVRVCIAPTCAATSAAHDSDAGALDAGPRGNCAESSESGRRHVRAAQDLGLHNVRATRARAT